MIPCVAKLSQSYLKGTTCLSYRSLKYLSLRTAPSFTGIKKTFNTLKRSAKFSLHQKICLQLEKNSKPPSPFTRPLITKLFFNPFPSNHPILSQISTDQMKKHPELSSLLRNLHRLSPLRATLQEEPDGTVLLILPKNLSTLLVNFLYKTKKAYRIQNREKLAIIAITREERLFAILHKFPESGSSVYIDLESLYSYIVFSQEAFYVSISSPQLEELRIKHGLLPNPYGKAFLCQTAYRASLPNQSKPFAPSYKLSPTCLSA